MSTITVIRTARTAHTCAACEQDIEPGQRYERHSMSPNDEHNGSGEWWTLARHTSSDCPLVPGGERMADYECMLCGGTGWINGRRCTGIAHSTRAH